MSKHNRLRRQHKAPPTTTHKVALTLTQVVGKPGHIHVHCATMDTPSVIAALERAAELLRKQSPGRTMEREQAFANMTDKEATGGVPTVSGVR